MTNQTQTTEQFLEIVPTNECVAEQETLNNEIIAIELEIGRLDKKWIDADSYSGLDWESRKMLRKQIRRNQDKLYNKKHNREDKLKEIKTLGVSSKQIRALVKEISLFSTEKYESSLGARDFIKRGFSKTLGILVRVEGTRFTSFMSNVRGCGSLSGKTYIKSLRGIANT